MKRLLVTVLVMATMLSGCAGKSAVRRAINEDPAMVFEVLRENKLQLLDIVQEALAEQDRLARVQQWQNELANPYRPVIEGDRPVLGSVIAPVTVVEYSDFFCPYCDRGSRTLHALLERHPDEIKIVFKHYPLHEGAEYLSALFEAIALQDRGAAWTYKQQVFAQQKAVQQEGADGPTLTAILDGLGVDVAKARVDAGSDAIRGRILADVEEARAFGFRGTPTYLVGGVAVRGAAPLPEFEAVLNMVLKGAEGAAECQECNSGQ